MHLHGLLISRQRGHEMPIGCRGRICIDHRKKIVAVVGSVTGPDEQVVIRSGRFLLLGERGNVYAIATKDERERETAHGELSQLPAVVCWFYVTTWCEQEPHS